MDATPAIKEEQLHLDSEPHTPQRSSDPQGSSSEQPPAPEAPPQTPPPQTPPPLDLRKWMEKPVFADFLSSIDESLWGEAVEGACLIGLACVRRTMKNPNATWGELHSLVTRMEQTRLQAPTPDADFRSRESGGAPQPHAPASGSSPPSSGPGSGLASAGRPESPPVPAEPPKPTAGGAGYPALTPRLQHEEDQPAYISFTELLLESPRASQAQHLERLSWPSPPGLSRPQGFNPQQRQQRTAPSGAGQGGPAHLAPGATWPPAKEPLSDFELIQSVEDSLNSWFVNVFDNVAKGGPAKPGAIRHFTCI